MLWLIIVIIIIIIIAVIYNYFFNYTQLNEYETISKNIIQQVYPDHTSHFKIYKTSGKNYYCKNNNIIYLHIQKNVSNNYDKQTIIHHLIIQLAVMMNSFIENQTYESIVEDITLNATLLKLYVPFKNIDPGYKY